MLVVYQTSVVGRPLRKKSRLVLIPVYGANTPFGSRTMVWRSHSRSSASFSRVFVPSPKRNPSGSTTAARPPSFSSRRISAMKRSAVSRVR